MLLSWLVAFVQAEVRPMFIGDVNISEQVARWAKDSKVPSAESLGPERRSFRLNNSMSEKLTGQDRLG